MATTAIAFVVTACGGDASTPAPSPAPAAATPAATAAPAGMAATPGAIASPAATASAPVSTAAPPPAAGASPGHAAVTSPTGVAGRWAEISRHHPSDGIENYGDERIRLFPLPDARVLVLASNGDGWSLTLVLDPATGAWTAGPRVAPGDGVSALQDGGVFVAGASEPTIWSEGAGGWTSAPDPPPASGADWPGLRTGASAVALADGSVLIAGGCSAVDGYGIAHTEADILTPGSGGAPSELVRTTLRYERVHAPAVRLADGRVLIAGSASGWDCTGTPPIPDEARWTAEVYDPRAGAFTLTSPLPDLAAEAAAAQGSPSPSEPTEVWDEGELVALADGGALLVGRQEHGQWPDGEWRTWRHTLRYDASTDRWTTIGIVPEWQGPVTGEGEDAGGLDRSGAATALLTDGRVLVAGGTVGGSGGWRPSRWADLYDPVAGTWAPLAPLPVGLGPAGAIGLADGTVIVVGASAAGRSLIAARLVPAGVESAPVP